MNTYSFRINATEEEMSAAMDIPTYSHLSAECHGGRRVFFQANNLAEAGNSIRSAMGRLYRSGGHVPFRED